MQNFLLESSIKKSNLKISYIANEKLNITEYEFMDKRNGIIPFTETEKTVLRDVLGLSETEFRSIFYPMQSAVDKLYNANETMQLLSMQTIGAIDKSDHAKADIRNLLTAYSNANEHDVTMLVLDAFQLGYIYGKRAERQKKTNR